MMNSLEYLIFFHKLKMNGDIYYDVLLSFCHIKLDTLFSGIFSEFSHLSPQLLLRSFDVSWLGKCPCMDESYS